MAAFRSKYVTACFFLCLAMPDLFTAEPMPCLRLPVVNTILMKYGYVKFWNVQIQRQSLDEDQYCSSGEMAKITNCGIEHLFGIFFCDRRLNNGRKGDRIDFNTELKTTCSKYASFKNCVQEHHVHQCLTIDKTMVDIIYSYICGSGRQALEEDYTGQCLSTLSDVSVVEVMKSQFGCWKGLNGFQSVLELMLSMYHDHDDPTGKTEIAGMKHVLLTLCRSWYTVETCILPVYGELCGQKARSFYAGLLHLIRTDLEKQFNPFGSELASLARCNEKIQSRVLKNVTIYDQVEFLPYLKRQLLKWRVAAFLTKQVKGPCAPMTTTLILTKCFWQALVDCGPGIEKLPNLELKLFSQMLMSFKKCYVGTVGSCGNKETIDFSDLINISMYLSSNAGQLMECLDVMSLLNVSEAACGLGFWDLVNDYIFKGTLIYISAMKSCSHSLPFQSFPELHCLADAWETASQNATHSAQSSTCAKRFFPYVIRFVRSLQTVTEQAITVFEEVFEDLCPK